MCGYSNYRTSSGCSTSGCGGKYNEFRSSSSCGGYIRPVTSGCGGGYIRPVTSGCGGGC